VLGGAFCTQLWNRAHHEKLIGPQLGKQFCALCAYVTYMLLLLLTECRHFVQVTESECFYVVTWWVGGEFDFILEVKAVHKVYNTESNFVSLSKGKYMADLLVGYSPYAVPLYRRHIQVCGGPAVLQLVHNVCE
jgi:hypothetical protein